MKTTTVFSTKNRIECISPLVLHLNPSFFPGIWFFCLGVTSLSYVNSNEYCGVSTLQLKVLDWAQFSSLGQVEVWECF